MAWELYRWVWRLESPLHIGAPPAGALNRTRLYVPARALWGALTAEIARRRNQNQFPDYQSVGRSILLKTRLSYLFPAEQVNGKWKAWLPRYEEGRGLVWEREGGREIRENRPFRMHLLITRPGTAIEPESDTASEGSLREFELISPYWRNAGSALKPVAMVGYLFCHDANLCQEICDIQNLFVGGDARYGLGNVQRIACEQANNVFGAGVGLDGDEPRVEAKCALAHVEISRDACKELLGQMEALARWDCGTLTPLSNLLWTPGSVSVVERSKKFRVTSEGYWRLLNHQEG